MGSPTTRDKKKAQEDVTESVKVALLISGADKTRFGKLKDELANYYLLGTDRKLPVNQGKQAIPRRRD